jgi:hypothetical protein
LTGAVELLAFGAMVMPLLWMETIHGWLGAGPMPTGPVFESVMREVSFVYGLQGITLWLIATDVVRYRPLVLLTGLGFLVAGPIFITIDALAGMPLFWVIGNGGPCLAIGALVLGLLYRDRS